MAFYSSQWRRGILTAREVQQSRRRRDEHSTTATILTCHQPTRQFCPTCRTPGHRPDVCHNPTARACDVCNLPNPEAGHTCVPKCALCGGHHLTAAKECENKLKRIEIWRKPAITEPPSAHRSPPASSSRFTQTTIKVDAPAPEAGSSHRSTRYDNGFPQHQQNRVASPARIDAKRQGHQGSSPYKRSVPDQHFRDMKHTTRVKIASGR
ncbi:hypothetical protein HPB52_016834 [Rhipicephalus sanguineus]|uniref:Uncharacterized protein n=1 Tax=Rhipicephalus sanguineus TaxID=34632 RepID=A0A9D4T423_RHISA|nr:hypothetical protein HPB52_016834 [Rhipicephalus sanguineus]